jgi:hypothetical protein
MDNFVEHAAQGGGILMLNGLIHTAQTKRLDSALSDPSGKPMGFDQRNTQGFLVSVFLAILPPSLPEGHQFFNRFATAGRFNSRRLEPSRALKVAITLLSTFEPPSDLVRMSRTPAASKHSAHTASSDNASTTGKPA